MSPRTPGPTKPGQPAHLQRGTHSSDHLLGLLCSRGERSLAHGQHPYLFCLSERVDFFSVQIQGGKRCSPKQNSKEVPTFHHPYLGEGMSARDQRAALSGAVTGDCLQQEGKVAKVGKKKKKKRPPGLRLGMHARMPPPSGQIWSCKSRALKAARVPEE